MSQEAYRVYRRDIAENPDVLEYFEQATPVNELDTARIGSRPARRSKGRRLEDLARHPLGLRMDAEPLRRPRMVRRGTLRWSSSRRKARHRNNFLREIAKGFPMFSGMLGNVELGMAKADLGIARDYSGLVKNAAVRKRVFSMLHEEFLRTRRMILRVTGQRDLLGEKSRAGAFHPAAQSLRRSHEPDPGRTTAPQTTRTSRVPSSNIQWARPSTESPPACTIRDRSRPSAIL